MIYVLILDVEHVPLFPCVTNGWVIFQIQSVIRCALSRIFWSIWYYLAFLDPIGVIGKISVFIEYHWCI